MATSQRRELTMAIDRLAVDTGSRGRRGRPRGLLTNDAAPSNYTPISERLVWRLGPIADAYVIDDAEYTKLS